MKIMYLLTVAIIALTGKSQDLGYNHDSLARPKTYKEAYNAWLAYSSPTTPAIGGTECAPINSGPNAIHGSTVECDPSTGKICIGGASWEETSAAFSSPSCKMPEGGFQDQYLVAIPAALFDLTRETTGDNTGNSNLCGKKLRIYNPREGGPKYIDATIFDRCGCGCSYPNGLDINDNAWRVVTGLSPGTGTTGKHERVEWNLLEEATIVGLH